MLSYALENGKELAIAPLLKTDQKRTGLEPNIEQSFGWGHIIQHEMLPDGRSNIILEGTGVCKLIDFKQSAPFLVASVEKFENDRKALKTEFYQEKLSELLVLTKRILLSEGAEEGLIMKMNLVTKHPHAVDFIASLLNYDFSQKQEILETIDLKEKVIKLLEIVSQLNLRE